MRNPELVKKELEEKAKEASARAAAGQSSNVNPSSPSQTCVADADVYTIEGSLNAIGAVTSPGASAYASRTEEMTLASSFRLAMPKQLREMKDVEVQLDEGELDKRKHRPDKRGFRIDDLNRFGGPRKKKAPPADAAGAEDTTGSSSNPNSNSSAVSLPIVGAQAPSPSSLEMAAEPESVADAQLSSVSTIANVSSNATSNHASRAECVTVERPEGFSNPVFALESRRPASATSPPSTDAVSALPPSYNSATRSLMEVVDGRAALPEWQAALLESAAAGAPATRSGARLSPVATAPGMQSDSSSSKGAESIEMASGSSPASQLRQRSTPRDWCRDSANLLLSYSNYLCTHFSCALYFKPVL